MASPSTGSFAPATVFSVLSNSAPSSSASWISSSESRGPVPPFAASLSAGSVPVGGGPEPPSCEPSPLRFRFRFRSRRPPWPWGSLCVSEGAMALPLSLMSCAGRELLRPRFRFRFRFRRRGGRWVLASSTCDGGSEGAGGRLVSEVGGMWGI